MIIHYHHNLCLNQKAENWNQSVEWKIKSCTKLVKCIYFSACLILFPNLEMQNCSQRNLPENLQTVIIMMLLVWFKTYIFKRDNKCLICELDLIIVHQLFLNHPWELKTCKKVNLLVTLVNKLWWWVLITLYYLIIRYSSA